MSIIMKRASTVQVAQRSRDEEKKIHQVEVIIMDVFHEEKRIHQVDVIIMDVFHEEKKMHQLEVIIMDVFHEDNQVEVIIMDVFHEEQKLHQAQRYKHCQKTYQGFFWDKMLNNSDK